MRGCFHSDLLWEMTIDHEVDQYLTTTSRILGEGRLFPVPLDSGSATTVKGSTA